MPTLYRICKTKFVSSAFDGEGARLHSGRWNSPGTPMVYLASSLSLAILEILVHADSSILPEYSYFEITCDEKFILDVSDIATLPPDWYTSPPPDEIRFIGDKWIADAKSALLSVPSAIVPHEKNFLLNPAHSDFKALNIGKPVSLALDRRLFK